MLITNGDLLTFNKFLELQNAGLYSIRVSFHGATPQGYANLHGVPESQFQKVRKNVNRILKVRRTTKILLTCIYVKGINEDTIEKWVKLWAKPDLMEIWREHNWNATLKFRKVQKKKRKTCGRIFKGPLQLQVDGTINACCFDWNGKLVFGDLKIQTLSDIFSSTKYNKIAQYHKTGNFKKSNLVCEHCDQRNVNKEESCIYSPKYNLKTRVGLTSTAYEEML